MNLLSALTLCVLVAMASADKASIDLEKAEDLFEQFIKENNRTYKDEEDRRIHYNAFVDNLKAINKLNAENPTATFGINKFADYTEEESRAMRGLKKID